MLDHLSLGTGDLARSKAFYDAALAPLGCRMVMEFPGTVGYGPSPQAPQFWIGACPEGKTISPGLGTHIAFAAPNRAAVDAFYAAAIAAGGQDNGKPGLRPNYHPNYYGAFVIDPDGHRVEAVCHLPA